MPGFNYLIGVGIKGENSLTRIIALTDKLEGNIVDVGSQVDRTTGKFNRMGDTGKRAFDGMRGSISSWIAGLGIGVATLASLSTAADQRSLEKAITFAGGEEGARNLAFVRNEADALKLPIQSALEGLKTLSGAMIGSGIEMNQQRDIFHAVAEASTVMGLKAQDTQLAFLAIGQIASKGRLQMEELRGQLGERIPGAFGIAARAMGVTTAEFSKMVERGLDAKDFLPRFAAEMHRTFGPGVSEALTGPRAAFNQFQNSLLLLRDTIGTELMPAATSLINVFIPMVKWVGENIKVLRFLATVIGGVWVATKLYAATAAIAAFATGVWTTAVSALAMYANPVGFLIGAIIAVGGAVVYAWNKFAGFRGFMIGMWEVIKEFGKLFWERVVTPFISFGKIVAGIFTFDTDLIASGINDAMKVVESYSTNAGKRMGNAFAAGRDNALGIHQGAFFDTSMGRDAYENARDDRQRAFGGANFDNLAAPPGKAPTEARAMAEGITGGGQRNVVINFNGKMIEQFVVNTTNFKEGADAAAQELLKKLSQVLNMANQVQVTNG